MAPRREGLPRLALMELAALESLPPAVDADVVARRNELRALIRPPLAQ